LFDCGEAFRNRKVKKTYIDRGVFVAVVRDYVFPSCGHGAQRAAPLHVHARCLRMWAAF